MTPAPPAIVGCSILRVLTRGIEGSMKQEGRETR
jgi:hypothetical protein